MSARRWSLVPWGRSTALSAVRSRLPIRISRQASAFRSGSASPRSSSASRQGQIFGREEGSGASRGPTGFSKGISRVVRVLNPLLGHPIRASAYCLRWSIRALHRGLAFFLVARIRTASRHVNLIIMVHKSLTHACTLGFALACCAMLVACGDDDGGGDNGVGDNDAGDNNDAGLPDAPLGGNHDLTTFPMDYSGFAYTASVDKEMTKQVRDVYANDVAVKSAAGDALDRGSVLVMEIHAAKLDDDEEPILDTDGRYIRDGLNIVAVMEKKKGFGQYSEATRNGEWEYAFYSPDGMPLDSEADCYGCHLENAGPDMDFVFTLDGLKSPPDVTAAPAGGDPSKITFPADYGSTFTYTTTVDKESNNQVRDVFANEAALSSADGPVLDRGATVVMEVYDAQVDGDDNPILDDDGRYVRGDLAVVAVMDKREGNGQYRPDSRNGEWEYAFFSPDGDPLEPEADCFGCHLQNTGTATDFIFTRDALSDPEMLPDAPRGGNNLLVKFPDDTADYTQYATVDRSDNGQVREIYANDVALNSSGDTLDRGSIIMMQIFSAQLDGDGAPVLDGDGRFMKDTLNTIAIMEKRRGFGKYSTNRNGEWEYAFFTPDGDPMPSEADCYGCHAMNAGEAQDFLFSRADLP